MITRASVANITPEGIALKIQEHNEDFPTLPINATVNASIGVSPWGVETGSTVETTATWDIFALFLRGVLTDLHEEAAYITQDGKRAYLLWADGKLDGLGEEFTEV